MMIPLIIQVNRQFERLFGYSQHELRSLIMRDGFRPLYALTLNGLERWQEQEIQMLFVFRTKL